MDAIDQQLLEIVLEVQQYSIESTGYTDLEIKIRTRSKKKALTRLVNAIQNSGKLYCQGKRNFPPQVYAEAIQETWLYVCKKADEYDPAKGKVMTWVNFILDKKFKDAIKKYLEEMKTRSLDDPIQNSDNGSITLGDTIESREYSCEYEEVRQIIVDDPDGRFKKKHIKGRPEVNFQDIALHRLEE